MSSQIKGPAILLDKVGYSVSRATATLPQTTTGALFTIAGGRVVLTGIVGEVTTIIQNQANNTKLVATPTVGTAVDICAVLDIANKEVGCLFGVTGTFATAMVGANAGATVFPTATGIVLATGTLRLSCAASNTGSVKWIVTYIPLDVGATMVAA
jgi:hypothetical protein